MSIYNPYSAPSANLDVKSTDNKYIDKLKQFPLFSTWGVVGLTMITAGLYVYYWLYSRTLILNNLLPKKPIAGWIPIITIVLVLINQAISIFLLVSTRFMELIDPDVFGTIYLISIPLNYITAIFFLIWIFSFRNRINILSRSSKGTQFWLGGILTFFINVFYFQYKINQIHENG
jgi:hypothetical protein